MGDILTRQSIMTWRTNVLAIIKKPMGCYLPSSFLNPTKWRFSIEICSNREQQMTQENNWQQHVIISLANFGESHRHNKQKNRHPAERGNSDANHFTCQSEIMDKKKICGITE